ncbi:hypothetical protein K1719_045796 [Acacia pycnantha]|nr:hypothetical protein K1719_045796 [Acacia pycnantha]
MGALFGKVLVEKLGVLKAELQALIEAQHVDEVNSVDKPVEAKDGRSTEAQKLLNYQSLDLQKFYSGARIFYNDEFHTVADPIRHFWDSARSLVNPIGSVVDKLLIGAARVQVLTKSDEEILSAEESTTIDLLQQIGFSDSIIGGFFRPFFGGIFFDRELKTTSRFEDGGIGRDRVPAEQTEVTEPKAAEVASPAGNRRKRNVGSNGNDLTTTIAFNALCCLPCHDATDGAEGVIIDYGKSGAETQSMDEGDCREEDGGDEADVDGEE